MTSRSRFKDFSVQGELSGRRLDQGPGFARSTRGEYRASRYLMVHSDRGIRSRSRNWWARIRRQDGRRVRLGPANQSPPPAQGRVLASSVSVPGAEQLGRLLAERPRMRSSRHDQSVISPQGDARYDRCQSEAEIRRGRRSRDAATISEADIRGEREQPQSRREQHVQAVDSCLHWFACAKEFQATSTTLMPRVARNRRHSSHTARASRRKLVIGGKSARVGGGGGNRTAD